jgi:hypothetical protein
MIDPQDGSGEVVALGLVEGGAGAKEVDAGVVGRAGAEEAPPAQDCLDDALVFGAGRPVNLDVRELDDLGGQERAISGRRCKWKPGVTEDCETAPD